MFEKMIKRESPRNEQFQIIDERDLPFPAPRSNEVIMIYPHEDMGGYMIMRHEREVPWE